MLYGVLGPTMPRCARSWMPYEIAERSGDDIALAFARMTLGIALVHHHTAAERDRGQQLLAEVSECSYAGDTTCAI